MVNGTIAAQVPIDVPTIVCQWETAISKIMKGKERAFTIGLKT
jgi:hypothetical protein